MNNQMRLGDGFQVGDLVQLNSGGPPMVVKSVVDLVYCSSILCEWINDAKIEREIFASVTLRYFTGMPIGPARIVDW